MESLHSKMLVDLASQVSHDIRSPLMALSSSAKSWIHLIPEDERLTIRSQIQRIQDIANELLQKRKKIEIGNTEDRDVYALAPELLSNCIEEIVTEKRMTFRQYLDLHIVPFVDQNYGVFSNINLADFKRVLSNLINNAVESYDDKKGEIKVFLKEDDLNAIIKIEDSGKGIPFEVLQKLGHSFVTYGKNKNTNSGTGLGVYHAKKIIESWGGKFEIESLVGKGTNITLLIPKTKPPKWIVSEIKLQQDQTVIILDDDQGIHQTWDKRFEKLKGDELNSKIRIIHLSTPKDFHSWVEKHGHEFNKNLYLFDLELLGYKENGLDLIERYALKNSAYLVTSHYEENKVRSRCEKLGVKIIPKMLADLVPIHIIKKYSEETSSILDIDVVLLDDDKYIRNDWAKSAKKSNIKFLALEKYEQLEFIADSLSKKHCIIYIDRELGEGQKKGEDIASVFHEMGFEHLFLATGHSAEKFMHLNWLTCVGKENPWDKDEDW